MSPNPETPELHPPDTHHFSSAIGWLELGVPAEADAELQRISAPCQNHPDVLELSWQICVARKHWETALQVAESLIQHAPESATGWVHRAYALRRAKGGGLEKAWEALFPTFSKFPKMPIIPYNLACYAAQFGRLADAWDWLHKAVEAGERVEIIKRMALADSDLKALWDRVRAW